MKPRVYIETSIPSFYFETRPEPNMVARREWTRTWRDKERRHYELVTSLAVMEELKYGNYLNKKACLSLMSPLELLPVNERVIQIAETYMSHLAMPVEPAGDAYHLALASYHSCNYLLTWNCRHLANPNKAEHIRHENILLGLPIPCLTTPLQLAAIGV